MAKKRTKRGDTSPLFERLEAVRLRAGIESKYAFAKKIGLSAGKYDHYKDTVKITPLQEIALQAMELDGIDWIEFPE